MDGGAGTAAAIRPACLWCDTAFEPRKAGSPQRFCTSKRREEFHSAGRRYAEHAVLSGQLTVAELRNGPAEACTLLGGQERRLNYPDIGYEETALSGRVRENCSSNCRSRQTAFSTFVGSAGSIQIRRRTPKLSAMRWRS